MAANKPVTEEVLREFLEKQTEYLEGKIETFKEDVDSKLTGIKDDVLNFKVEFLGEIKSLREEVHVTTAYRDLIANNEKRIEKLEVQIKHLRAN